MEQQQDRSFRPPYLPWKTFFNFLDRLDESGVPDRIDRSYLSNMDGTAQSHLMTLLKSFGLTDDDGRAQPAMGDVVPQANRRDGIRRLLETHYAPMVALPTNATQAQLDELFRPFGLGVDANRKAQTFFLRAAGYVGLPLSTNFKNPAGAPGEGSARPRRQGSTRRRQKREAGDGDSVNAHAPASPPPPSAKGISIDVHPMLAGSIQWLAEHGQRWTAEQAESWIAAFTGSVRLVYPTRQAATQTPRREAAASEEGASGD